MLRIVALLSLALRGVEACSFYRRVTCDEAGCACADKCMNTWIVWPICPRWAVVQNVRRTLQPTDMHDAYVRPRAGQHGCGQLRRDWLHALLAASGADGRAVRHYHLRHVDAADAATAAPALDAATEVWRVTELEPLRLAAQRS